MMIRLYGTVTSPYVRRVRIVAAELGLAYNLIDTASAEGQAELRTHSPIWKVPAAQVDGQLVLDSHAITELLLAGHGTDERAALAVDDLEARNTISVIDGALDALINTFYLEKEGVRAEDVRYVQKQRDRAHSALQWLSARVQGAFVTSRRCFGLPEIALGTSLAWMQFRDAYPIDRHPRLVSCLGELEQRASFAASRPSA